LNTRTENITIQSAFATKVSELKSLVKFNLSMTVVFSSAMVFWIASAHNFKFLSFLIFILGGTLVTFAANIFNEILEKDYDRLMKRTENRPLVTGKIKITEAILLAGIFTISGTIVLCYFNIFTGFLGLLSVVLYAFVYTPMKRISSFSVFVGAIPGAIPMIMGCSAVQNTQISHFAFLIFLIQFVWQFPHFWSIAWLGHDDYSNAGFKLLPNKNNELNSIVGKQAFYYSFLLVPITLALFFYTYISLVGFFVAILPVLMMMFYAYQLSVKCDKVSAKKLMFSSLIYLPFVLSVILIDQYI
jgi:heme o synthase